MKSSPLSLPDYENPPVIEVVFGVHFETLRDFKAPHTGLFWDKLDREEYPDCEERPPIGFVQEVFGETPPPLAVSIEQLTHPPLPRLFFINKVRNHLVQVQQDGFLQNWRKLQADNKYPRYEELFPKFLDSWGLFTAFLKEQNIGEAKVRQYELTYMNHILRGEGWLYPNEVGSVFRDLSYAKNERFLAEPESVAWRTTYRLPDNKGRLHVRMNQAVSRQTKDQVFVLELTARGINDEGVQAWFDMAHEWIVRGFEDLTTMEIQEKIWKKK
ncbi:MAG: TIGR04255 family protein [Planctomycetes bacterium]|nr:TIGR04255 family protein [Planctomycetota bacterium]